MSPVDTLQKSVYLDVLPTIGERMEQDSESTLPFILYIALNFFLVGIPALIDFIIQRANFNALDGRLTDLNLAVISLAQDQKEVLRDFSVTDSRKQGMFPVGQSSDVTTYREKKENKCSFGGSLPYTSTESVDSLVTAFKFINVVYNEHKLGSKVKPGDLRYQETFEGYLNRLSDRVIAYQAADESQ